MGCSRRRHALATREAHDQARTADRALLADGNPGLQAVLTRPILVGETEVAAQAMAHIGHYQQHGVPPADIQRLIDQGAAADAGNATLAFFKRMAFHAYRQALTPAQAELLKQQGCTLQQGFLHDRPRAVALFEQELLSRGLARRDTGSECVTPSTTWAA